MADLYWLDPINPVFPDTHQALTEPSGLLAAGGNLSVDTLKKAYFHGVFPWYSENEPPLWWSPDPRAIVLPGDLHIGRSNKKLIKHQRFSFTTNHAFSQVIENCSALRQQETWIVDEMVDAYNALHEAGAAHSLEVWQEQTLVGGLYGVQVGAVFCGESMFHLQPNSSKLAFICLCKTLFSHGFKMIDCQLINPFLASLGAKEVSRPYFEDRLLKHRDTQLSWPSSWSIKPESP